MADSRSVLVLLSARGGGDRPPVIALACGLRDRGYQVTILCDSATEQLVSSTGLATNTIPPVLDKRGSVQRWFRTLDTEGSKKDGSASNPLIEWAEDILPFGRTAALDLKSNLIVSSLFCMGLAEALASDLDVPWCFVNPSFYFGDYSRRAWEEDWFGPYIPRLARDCFLPPL